MKFKKSLYFFAFLILIMLMNCNLVLATSNDGILAPEIDKLHHKIANKTISCVEEFVTRFNEKSQSKVFIRETFYDQKFHRIYIDIEGTITISKSIHKLFIKGEKIYSSDGEFAFDMAFTNPVSINGQMHYEIDCELIIFQENILENIARVTPGVSIAYSSVGETVLKFLEEARIRALADIAAEAVTSFSPEKLKQLKAELKKRADQMGDNNLKRILFLTAKTGYFTRFFILSLVKSIPKMLGGSVGSSIGSVVGTFLLPGGGTLVGAYIGSVISGQIVYASQYRIPINMKIARMKTLGKLCKNGNQDNIAGRKFNKIRKKFNQDIRHDLDKHSYIVVDEVLRSLREMKKKRKKLVKTISKDLQNILKYQLVHEKDRYASRKLKQLKEI